MGREGRDVPEVEDGADGAAVARSRPPHPTRPPPPLPSRALTDACVAVLGARRAREHRREKRARILRRPRQWVLQACRQTSAGNALVLRSDGFERPRHLRPRVAGAAERLKRSFLPARIRHVEVRQRVLGEEQLAAEEWHGLGGDCVSSSERRRGLDGDRLGCCRRHLDRVVEQAATLF